MNKQIITTFLAGIGLVSATIVGVQSQAKMGLLTPGYAMAGLAKMQGASSLPIEKAAPALAEGVWINSKPTTIAAQRGKVVVLTFWTHGCINCKRTLPFWNDWAKRYTGKDVTVLSVHTPELAFERSESNVRRFVKERGITFPVLTDNENTSWDAFGISSWPTTVLIDKQGRIRARWEGELDWNGSGDYKKVEAQIEQLRKEGSR